MTVPMLAGTYSQAHLETLRLIARRFEQLNDLSMTARKADVSCRWPRLDTQPYTGVK